MTKEALTRFFDHKKATPLAQESAASSAPSTPENASTYLGSPAPMETLLETCEVPCEDESIFQRDHHPSQKAESSIADNTSKLVDILARGHGEGCGLR